MLSSFLRGSERPSITRDLLKLMAGERQACLLVKTMGHREFRAWLAGERSVKKSSHFQNLVANAFFKKK